MKRKKFKTSRSYLLHLRNKIARAHLESMLQQAISMATQHKIDMAEKFGYKARMFARRFGIRIPRHWKIFFCPKCKNFVFPGITARIRIRQNRTPHIVIQCLKCKNFKRIPIK